MKYKWLGRILGKFSLGDNGLAKLGQTAYNYMISKDIVGMIQFRE